MEHNLEFRPTVTNEYHVYANVYNEGWGIASIYFGKLFSSNGKWYYQQELRKWNLTTTNLSDIVNKLNELNKENYSDE